MDLNPPRQYKIHTRINPPVHHRKAEHSWMSRDHTHHRPHGKIRRKNHSDF